MYRHCNACSNSGLPLLLLLLLLPLLPLLLLLLLLRVGRLKRNKLATKQSHKYKACSKLFK